MFINGIYPWLNMATDEHKLIPSNTQIKLENDDVYPT